MRKDATWGLVAMLALGACGQGGGGNADSPVATPPGRTVTPADSAQVNIGVNCNGNGIDVDVDKWVVDLNPRGALSFAVVNKGTNPGLVPVVDIQRAQKQGSPWPFAGFPGQVPAGGARGVGRANGRTGRTTPAYYAIKVVCGTGPNRQTVVIDPDVFVD